MYKEITTLRELRESTLGTGTTLLIFHATWCGPCRAYTPIYERVGRNNPDVKIIRSDVDMSKELVDHFSIKSVPTTVIIKNGKVEALNGPISYGQLNERVS